MKRLTRTLLWGALVSCNANAPAYFPPERALEAGGDDVGRATSVVDLPFRVPTEEERDLLGEEARRLKLRRVPWLRRSTIRISVQYRIVNLSPQEGVARVFMDGANEYADYDSDAIASSQQAASGDDERPFVPALVQLPPATVPPRGVVTGEIREDDVDEAELDLYAISDFMALPLSVLINRSEVNPVGLETVPKDPIVPALFRVRMALEANRAMRLEYLVRVRDGEEQLAEEGEMTFRPRVAAYGVVRNDGGMAADAGGP